MTAIELFDRKPIENVICSLTTKPDKIIFVGDGESMKEFEPIYRKFLENRGLNIELEYRTICRNQVSSIVEVLSEIVEGEEECVFDLTGGEELVLVAMGIVFQKYQGLKNIQMQRFNLNNGVITDCDGDGNVIYSGVPEVSVAENVQLHGGRIRYETDGNDLSEEFMKDLRNLWGICKKDPKLWNAQINIFEMFDVLGLDNSSLEVKVNIAKLTAHLRNSGRRNVPIKGLLEALAKYNLIYNYSNNNAEIQFRYKNHQIKKCLTKAGVVLELMVLVTARGLKNEDGSSVYTDFKNGVYIDWDGRESGRDERDTVNEIDVILMKGMIPVFISCKNGNVGEDELYKLDAVVSRFGGVYAKKVLIATNLGKIPDSMEHFKQRAKDMKINLIDGVHELDDARFERVIRNLLHS